jgi:beta-lactamase class A
MTRRRAGLRLGVLALLTAAAAAPPLGAQETTPRLAPNAGADALLARLQEEVDRVGSRLDGVLGVCVEDLAGGSVIERNADLTFATASAIKPAILYELYRQAEEGRIDLLEPTEPGLPRVGGGGVLEKLGPGVRLSWRDVAVLMMVWSDNEATNVLIRRLGLAAVNRRLDALGLTHTRLRRQMMDLEAARRGHENVATPRELARLARTIAGGQGLSPERARDLLALATLPAEGSPFRRGLPEGVRALAKPGSLEGVRAEVAWVDVPGRPYAAAIMTGYLAREADGEAAISQLSAAFHSTFDRLARSSEHGRVISERDARK